MHSKRALQRSPVIPKSDVLIDAKRALKKSLMTPKRDLLTDAYLTWVWVCKPKDTDIGSHQVCYD